MKKVLITSIVCSSIALSGCATIIHGSNDEVGINSYPDRASFSVKNSKGVVVHRGTTPQLVDLERGNGYFKGAKYTVEFDDPNYLTQFHTINSSISGWYWGNLLFGGLIGFIGVDPGTGGMWDLDDDVGVNLVKKPAPKLSMSQ